MGALTQQLRELFEEDGEAVAEAIEESGEEAAEGQQPFTVASVMQALSGGQALQQILRQAAHSAGELGLDTGLKRTTGAGAGEEPPGDGADGPSVPASGGSGNLNPNYDRESRAAQSTVRRIVGKAKGIRQTTKRRLRDAIEEGLDENETVGDIARRVRNEAEDMSQSRARTIAQTTVTGAFEYQQLEAFRAAGFEGKRWITQRDGRVRTTHVEAGGQERPLDVHFEVGGSMLMVPSDPMVSDASEVVNCRCTMFPVNSLSDDE